MSTLPAGYVTLDGWKANFKTTRFRASHPTNPMSTMVFHSSAWMIPDSEEGVAAAVDLFVRQSRQNPDPGIQAGKQRLPKIGWNESSVTLRLKTALCLYRAGDDAAKAKLLPAIDALIAANMDEARYYGPPRSKPHNHGVMADRELLNAANVLDRPDLADYAAGRLVTQLSGYDNCGFMFEQSSGYQHFHAGLWTQIARRVDSEKFKTQIEALVAHIRSAADGTTYPDGSTPVIGDGSAKQLDDLVPVSEDVDLFCPESGWFSDRAFSPTLSQQVVGRFGPGTQKHGHADKGAVTWWVGEGNVGTQVLVDRGLNGKNRDARWDYAQGAEAHAVVLWEGGSDGRSSAKRVRSSSGNVYTITADRRAGVWKRVVRMDDEQATLMLRDRVTGAAGAKMMTVNLPLDPSWSPSGAGTFRNGDGSVLTVSCATFKGKPVTVKNVKVEDFQTDGIRSATTVRCSATGSDGVKTVLTVR